LQHLEREFGHLRHQQRHFVVQNFDGTLGIVRVLRDNPTKSQDEIIEILSTRYLNMAPAAVRRSVELTVRVWLTLNINSSSVVVGPTFADETPLDWDPDVSLDVLVQRQFLKSGGGRGKTAKSNIDPAMTAAYLASTCGLRFRWTDSPLEYLQFDATRQTLVVYRHRVCLVNHIESTGDCPIPEALLNEILDMLNLLFPFGDVGTKPLLLKKARNCCTGAEAAVVVGSWIWRIRSIFKRSCSILSTRSTSRQKLGCSLQPTEETRWSGQYFG
jgi:hypothetical protein